MPYVGAPVLGTFGTGTKDRFSGNNSSTAFTMSRSVGNANDIDVFVENVRQEPSIAYTVSGTTLSFTGTPATGSNNIYVVHKANSVSVTPPSGRSTDNVADLQVTSTLSGELISGTLNRPVGLNATDGSATDAGDRIILNGTDNGSSNADDSLLYEEATDDVGLVTGTAVDTFTFDGNAKVEGTMRASATGAIKVEGNTDDGILILDASASGVDVGSAIVFEEGTDDGSMALSGVTRLSNLESIERGVTAKTEISDGGSSKILDFDTNQNFIINMNASLTLGQPVTGQVGQTGFIVFKQDASGSRTLTLNSAFKNPGGTAPTLTTTANGIDVVGYIVSAPNEILLSTAQLAFA
tara:strand:+ start:1033 stop:2091 length:1059 start_codon:yes stop_codon:yes gene_type:complete